MNAMRQDAWTEYDDSKLAETTIRHIKEGGTQLSAFAEVGQIIGRTQAACGFRWNSYLRKLYDKEVRQAKTERQKLQVDRRKVSYKKRVEVLTWREGADPTEWMSQVQYWLTKWRELHLELAEKTSELERLRKENDDYRTLLQLLDRARNMSIPS